MAKKIVVHHKKIKKQSKERKPKKSIFKTLLKVLFVLLFIAAISGSGFFGYKYYKLKNKYNDLQYKYNNVSVNINNLQTKYNSVNNDLKSLIGNNTVYYTKQKLKFLDENIAIVIQGYGNYYYTYDCVQKKVNTAYSFWAYNTEAAISKGYWKGTC